jgi:hypothetical protein
MSHRYPFKAGIGMIVAAWTVAVALAAQAQAQSSDPDWIDRAFAGTSAAATAARSPPRRRHMPLVAVARTSSGSSEHAAHLGDGDACIPTALQRALADVAATFGAVSITSTCRTRSQNAAAGGVSRSLHLSGQAVDFRVSGAPLAVQAFLARHPDVGGLKHYGGGLFHIDTGERRSF